MGEVSTGTGVMQSQRCAQDEKKRCEKQHEDAGAVGRILTLIND